MPPPWIFICYKCAPLELRNSQIFVILLYNIINCPPFAPKRVPPLAGNVPLPGENPADVSGFFAFQKLLFPERTNFHEIVGKLFLTEFF